MTFEFNLYRKYHLYEKMSKLFGEPVKKLTMLPEHSESIDILGKAILEHKQAIFVRRKKNQRFSLKKSGQISYLVQGEISVLRRSDGSPSLTLKAPTILGFAQMRSISETHHMRCLMECEMWDLDENEAMQMMDQKQLWKHAFDILTLHLHMYYEKEYLNSLPNARSKVLENLKLLWSEEPEIRLHHSIYNFTISRSKMSRSSVHKVLKDLESEGVILTRRGKLLNLKSQP